MSALGHKRTFATQKAMSALPPIATVKADIKRRLLKAKRKYPTKLEHHRNQRRTRGVKFGLQMTCNSLVFGGAW
jgi:hypothetical protein